MPVRKSIKKVIKAKPPKIVREKAKKRETKRQFWNIFLMQAGLSLVTFVIAIAATVRIGQLQDAKQIYLPTTTIQDFLLSFLLVTLAIVLVVLFKKGEKWKGNLYKGLFLVASFVGGMALLQLFLPIFFSLVVMGGLLLIWLKKPTILVHDALMVFALAGVASFVGSELSTSNVIILLVLFSVYDGFAVYTTKHMVVMAREMMAKKVVLGFIIPKEPKNVDQDLEKMIVGKNVMMLGGGDVVFPAMLVVSVASIDVLKAAIVAIFALGGSLLSYHLFNRQEKKEPIPALPPIALATLVGYLLTLFW